MFPWATTDGLAARVTPGRRGLQASPPRPHSPGPASCPEAHVHAHPPALGAGWVPSWGLDSPFSPVGPPALHCPRAAGSLRFYVKYV